MATAPQRNNGLPYASRHRDGYLVGHAFNSAHPGRPSADAQAIALRTDDGRLFLLHMGTGRSGEPKVAVFDVEKSKSLATTGAEISLVEPNKNPFPAIGEPFKGSRVAVIQAVEDKVKDIKAAKDWGAEHEVEDGPLLQAERELTQINDAYQGIAFDPAPETRRFITTGPPNNERLVEAAAKWVVDATPSVPWAEFEGRTSAQKLMAALHDGSTRQEVLKPLGRTLGELQAGDYRALKTAESALGTLQDASFDPGNEALQALTSLHIEMPTRSQGLDTP